MKQVLEFIANIGNLILAVILTVVALIVGGISWIGETIDRWIRASMVDQKVEALCRSAERMKEAMSLPRDRYWWKFMQKETWIQLKRALRLWLHFHRG